MSTTQPHYHVYTLRLWEEPSLQADTTEWRFALQDMRTGSKYGFTSLDRLLGFLRTQTESQADQAGQGTGRANQELAAYAHTVAHDLKNPLGVLIGFANVLKDHQDVMDEQERASLCADIVRTAWRANAIVDELLLLAEMRDTEVEPEPLNMAVVVEAVCHHMEHLFKKSRAEIVIPQQWPKALGYAAWIEEVWINLISNALKYGGQPPRVELGYSTLQTRAPAVTGVANRTSHISFWVRDNGVGLGPEEQAQLFSPFVRLNQMRARGHGLGLSIVRRIVEKLGGQVGVESTPGQGSTFWFTLPTSPDSIGKDLVPDAT